MSNLFRFAFKMKSANSVRSYSKQGKRHIKKNTPSLLASCRKHQKYFAQIILASYLSAPGVLLAGGATAANSAHAPKFDTAGNGVPIVNINAPSSKGVSRNEYDKLNVNSAGLIFNNSTDIVKTQLAGFIDGNSNLSGRNASIILNQVLGNSRSALNGYMEIAGRSAELIIANRNGITCNGCGFINTNRGVLTTGKAIFDSAGGLSGFDINQGDVDITGLGLNASNVDEVDILARSVSVNADFWANEATIITGKNVIDYKDKSVKSSSASGTSGYSLDVAAIGGMYANRITLIGTDKGLGVNFGGNISATESMVLDSQGNLANSAKVSAKVLTVSAKDILNTGEILSEKTTLVANNLSNIGNSSNIQSKDTLTATIEGTISNQSSAVIQSVDGKITLNADSIINEDGAKIQTADSQITLDTNALKNQNGAIIQSINDEIIINADTINNQSTIAANQLTISANELNNSTEKGEVYGTEKVDLTLTGQLNNSDSALLQSDNQLIVNVSGDIANTKATIAAIDTAAINSSNLINTGNLIAKNNNLALTTNTIDNQGTLSGNGITIHATDLNNSTVNGKVYSSADADLHISGNFVNNNGALVHSDTNVTLDVDGNITNTASTIEVLDTAVINSQNITNSGTVLAQDGVLRIKTQSLNNQALLGGKNIDISASALNNNTNSSQIYGNYDVSVMTSGDIINSNQALIHAGNNLNLKASLGGIVNNNSTIESAENLNVDAAGVLTNAISSKINSQSGKLTITANKVNNQGSLSGNGLEAIAQLITNNTSTSIIESSGDLALTSNQSFSNTNGAKVKANGTLTINTDGDITNTGSTLSSVSNITLNSRNLGNTKTGLISAQNGTLTVNNSGSLTNQGGIAGTWVNINAGSINNSGSSALILGKDYLDVRSNGNIKNLDGGVFYSLGNAYLQTNNTLLNSSATIESQNDLSIKANRITNKKTKFSVSNHVNSKSYSVNIAVPDGYDSAVRNYTVTTTTPYISANSAQGYILSGGNMSLNGYIDNLYSTISSVGNLNFSSGKLNRVSSEAVQTTVSAGTSYFSYREKYCDHRVAGYCVDHDHRTVTDTSPYNTTTRKNVVLASDTFTAGGNITGKAGSISSISNISNVSSNSVSHQNLNVEGEGALTTVGFDSVAVRRGEIFDNISITDYTQNALFEASKNGSYLIETNPLLTNYDNFISSDYLINKLISNSSDGDVQLAMRLGDGFLEQQLVRDQILSFTGQQTIPDSVSIEDTYSSLMNNALNSYESLQLAPGVELSDGQISKLQEPIVWMVQETIDTPTGSQQALVPKVYFSENSGFQLRPDGSLMAASSIDIEADEINNSGSMLASVDLSLKGSNITNSGTLSSGNSMSLIAKNDITNSGAVQAVGALNLDAGGSIISETKTTVLNYQSDGHSSTETLVGNTASIQGGSVSLTAGKDISLIGSDLNATENVFVDAGNNFTLASLKITNSSKDGDHSSYSSTKNQVSSLSGNNIQINAGNTFTSEGANIDASGDLGVSATNIDLLAVIDTEDNYSKVGSGNNYTKTSSHNESVTGSSLSSGGNLSLVASNDIYSEGTAVAADGNLALAAGNDVILTTVTAVNTSSSETKSKKSGIFGSTTKVTSSSSESITNQGTSLASGGNVSISSGNDTILVGSTAQAEGSIAVDAGGEVLLLSAVDQTSESSQSEKKGSFKVKTTNAGSITQTSVGSGFIAQGDVSIESDENITLEGATLASGETLSLAAGGNDAEAVTQNAQGDYVNADGKVVGNITLGTQALQNSEWNESSSSYRGIVKDLVKGIAVVASVGTAGLVHGDITVGESESTRVKSIKQEVSTIQANDLEIDAKNDVTLIGTDVLVANNATINAKNVIIDAAQEQTVVSHSNSKESVSADGANFNSDTGEASLFSVAVTDQTDTTTSTANTWSGSNLNVGNLTINADENVAIIASDINVENNASIEAENILIGGREDTYETTNESITQIETMSVGAKNTYNDVYLAGMAVEKASEAVGDAQKAYDDAKRQVAAGTLSSSDLEFYKYQLDTAKESEDYVQLALVNSVAAAAMSNATAGFTATASTSTTTATNTQTITEGVWNGSTINVGNNASFNSDNNLTLEGSSVVAGGILEANADNIEILAGTNTYSETSSSDSQSASASVSYSGGPSISGSVGVNTSSSDSSSKSTSYTNSSLSGGSVVSNSDSLTLKGGNIYGDSVAINTGELNIVSLQDTAQSQSESQSHGVSVNGSFKPSSGKSSLDGGGLSYSESNTESSYASVNQQSGITTGDGGYNINVTGNTNLEGGLIASTDAAETEGNNSFSTGTLTQSDLENHAEFSGEAFGIDVSINKSDSGKYGPSRSTGYGDTEFSQTATTASGINTANVVITDKAGQQALTGETTEQAIVNVQTDTTTETADLDSGALNNHFDQAEVEGTVNTQQAVTQAFDQNVTELKGIVNGQLSDLKDDLDKKLGSGEITEEQYNSEIQTLQNYNLLLSVASAAVTAPTDSVTGQVAAMASPVVASEIGQYFKGLATNNEDGNLSGAEEAAHVLAHGVLAAAVASAGGNDALTAGVSAAASEGAAPLLSQWLYGEENGSELTADQKETISSILSLASTAVGATTGNASDAIAAGQASENAVENNFNLHGLDMNPFNAPDAVNQAYVEPVVEVIKNIETTAKEVHEYHAGADSPDGQYFAVGITYDAFVSVGGVGGDVVLYYGEGEIGFAGSTYGGLGLDAGLGITTQVLTNPNQFDGISTHAEGGASGFVQASQSSSDITAIDFNIGIPTPSGHIGTGVGEHIKIFDFNDD